MAGVELSSCGRCDRTLFNGGELKLWPRRRVGGKLPIPLPLALPWSGRQGQGWEYVPLGSTSPFHL
jgi:hypothetical protein